MKHAPTFDESWHQVEDRRVALRPGVEIFPQRFRGERWYVVRDALGNRFFRIRPPAYRFICELERSSTVGEAWERSLDASPEEAPGQGEIVQLLSQLHQTGLLRSDLEGDAASLFAAGEKEHRQKVKQQWSSLLFIRIPLFNPDRFLKRSLPYVRWIISPFGMLAWLVMLAIGAKAIMENWPQFRGEAGGLLGISNLPWLYAAMILVKGCHEYGHGYFCRKYGGEVPQMGIMLLLLNPLPFVDASSSWAFREKSKRILVAAAGMIVEIFLACIAAVIWANTGEGLVHTVAYNMIVVASIGTLLFNLNPLLRFDGYHILSDIVEVPNLQGRASRTTLYLFERYLFRVPNSVNPAHSRTETFWLAVYFVAVFVYRILLLFGILLLVSHWFFILGVVLAVVFGFLWFVLPIVKAVKYLCTSPRIEARRTQAVSLSLGLVGSVVAVLALVPMPSHFRADGVVRSEAFAHVFAGATGQLSELLAASGTIVEKGQPILRFTNFELEREIEMTQMDLAKTLAQRHEALEVDPVRYLSLEGYLQSMRARLKKLEQQQDSLIVTAPESGRWLAPDLVTLRGTTLPRGTELGVIQGEGRHYLAAAVQQADVARLFGGNIEKTGVKVRGQEKWTLSVVDLQAIPAEFEPESRGAAAPGAGLEGVDPTRGTPSSEPFFEVRAYLEAQPQSFQVHGQQGIARFDLPREPLLSQWSRRLRQLFQRNYRI